ncbi:SMC-Scp complex subunit ScpB [Pseudactinotalea sp. Z1748]|uniref:SMC-Scp complex subunit ScpB n=1 Tax=Pseudactinotalea sp. Z1748 TaxID=3413027 RepID=UPI003C7D84DE
MNQEHPSDPGAAITDDDATPAGHDGSAPSEAGGADTEGPLPVLGEPGGLHGALEAILMVTDAPVATEHLASVLKVPTEQIRTALAELVRDYAEGPRPRGFELREAGGGWRVYSAPAFADAVEAFVLEGQTARLTQASLETLAVIAYRQPVSRGRIAAIRGVNVDSVVRTLLTRGLIEEAGQDEEGGAMRYRTTAYFLERLGLRTIEDLPPLAPYLPDLDSLADVDGLG